VQDDRDNGAGRKPGLSRRGMLQAGLIARPVPASAAGPRPQAPRSVPTGGIIATCVSQGRCRTRTCPREPTPIPRIQHIVILMQENHSYDNRLGMLRRFDADGFRLGFDGLPLNMNPYANGDIQHAFHMPTYIEAAARALSWPLGVTAISAPMPPSAWLAPIMHVGTAARGPSSSRQKQPSATRAAPAPQPPRVIRYTSHAPVGESFTSHPCASTIAGDP
jgi:hypothetical protein